MTQQLLNKEIFTLISTLSQPDGQPLELDDVNNKYFDSLAVQLPIITVYQAWIRPNFRKIFAIQDEARLEQHAITYKIARRMLDICGITLHSNSILDTYLLDTLCDVIDGRKRWVKQRLKPYFISNFCAMGFSSCVGTNGQNMAWTQAEIDEYWRREFGTEEEPTDDELRKTGEVFAMGCDIILKLGQTLKSARCLLDDIERKINVLDCVEELNASSFWGC